MRHWRHDMITYKPYFLSFFHRNIITELVEFYKGASPIGRNNYVVQLSAARSGSTTDKQNSKGRDTIPERTEGKKGLEINWTVRRLLSCRKESRGT